MKSITFVATAALTIASTPNVFAQSKMIYKNV